MGKEESAMGKGESAMRNRKRKQQKENVNDQWGMRKAQHTISTSWVLDVKNVSKTWSVSYRVVFTFRFSFTASTKWNTGVVCAR